MMNILKSKIYSFIDKHEFIARFIFIFLITLITLSLTILSYFLLYWIVNIFVEGVINVLFLLLGVFLFSLFLSLLIFLIKSYEENF